MTVFQIIEFSVTFVEVMVGILIVMRVIGQEKVRLKESLIATLIISAIVVWGINQFQLFSILGTVIGILGITITSSTLYNIRIYDALLVSSAYLLLIYIVDFLVLTLLGVFLRDYQFAERVAESFSYARVCFILLSKTLLISIYFIFARRFLTKVDTSIRKMWIGVILCAVLVFYFVKNTFLQINQNILFMWILLLLLVLISVYSAMQWGLYLNEKNRILMVAERNNLMAENYDKAIKSYQSQQIAQHDLKNQYLVIETYLRRKEYEKAEDYVVNLETYLCRDIMLHTGIDSLDVLLECKVKEAEIQGVSMEITADIIQLKLKNQDLISLMGNALDNALDACKTVIEGNRWIQVVIRRVQEMTFIKISNSCGETPVQVDGRFLSSKRGNQMQGLGMTSMEFVVDKYEGTLHTEYGQNQFTVVISFFH